MLWKHQDAKLLVSGQFLECLSEDLGHGKKQNRTRLNLYCSTLKLDLYQEDIEFVPYPYETKVSLRGVHFLDISIIVPALRDSNASLRTCAAGCDWEIILF